MTMDQVLTEMIAKFNPAQAKGTNTQVQLNFSGEGGGLYCIHINEGKAHYTQGAVEKPAATLKTSTKDWIEIMTGKLDASTAFMMGKLIIEGDMELMMRLQSLFIR